MATTFIYLPPTGSGSEYWQDAVSTTGDLPAVDNVIGEVRLVRADNSLRYWDGAAWQVLIAGPSGTYVLKSGDTMSGNLVISTLTADRALVTNGTKTLSSATTTAAEIGYVNGVTSAIQTQIDAKEPTITVLPVSKGGTNSGAALTSGKAMISTAGAVVESAVTSTELGYVSGVTSAIQTQLGTKVTGPASATANAMTRYDSTTGKLVKDSAVTLDDAGGMTFTGTTGFMRLPNLTTVQRNALTAANGMLIYNTTTDKVQASENAAWVDVTGWGS